MEVKNKLPIAAYGEISITHIFLCVMSLVLNNRFLIKVIQMHFVIDA